jgi:hypothetical protein
MGFLLGTVFPILMHSPQIDRTIWWVFNVSSCLSAPTSAQVQISGCGSLLAYYANSIGVVRYICSRTFTTPSSFSLNIKVSSRINIKKMHYHRNNNNLIQKKGQRLMAIYR